MEIDYNNLGNEDFVLMEFDGSDYSVDAYTDDGGRYQWCLTDSYQVYFDDTYSNEHDEDINRLLKKFKQLKCVTFANTAKELNVNLLIAFHGLEHIEYFQMIGSYLNRKQYQNLAVLKNLKRFSIKVYDARDIKFEKFSNLEKCYMQISKQRSTSEQIEASKKYIEELKEKYPNIKFELDIQKY